MRREMGHDPVAVRVLADQDLNNTTETKGRQDVKTHLRKTRDAEILL